MEWTLLVAILAAITLLITIFLFLKSRTEKVNEPIRNENQRVVNENIPRRAQVVRNQRARLRANVRHYDNLDNEEENIAADENIEPANRNNLDIPDLDKVGAKKRAKLEAKAERKVQREHEEQEREERKKRAELAEEERKKASEKEAEEEKKREEEERKAREEEEKREHEEYLKLKAAFQVEEEGFDENEVDDEKNLLEEFIKFIKDNKVVIIEDVATHFKLKTQAVIDRIQQLRIDGRLSGVIDDRGKFIYISHEELKSIAQFIKNRGRVSIAELAENSNQLISLTPQVS